MVRYFIKLFYTVGIASSHIALLYADPSMLHNKSMEQGTAELTCNYSIVIRHGCVDMSMRSIC